MQVLTLYNIKGYLVNGPVLKIARVYGANNINTYQLLEGVDILLSDGDTLSIPAGYIWDLSSVPRFLWGILAPDGDFQLAALIHDFLYEFKAKSRMFADKEMLIWSGAINGTKKISFRNFDNRVRYLGVRAFGWYVWNK
jgi:hypothetical protein